MINPYNEFELQKRSLSQKARAISGISWAIFGLLVILLIIFVSVLASIGIGLYENSDTYQLINYLTSYKYIGGIIWAFVILLFAIIALLVLFIILYVYYFQFGSRLQRFSHSTQELANLNTAGLLIVIGNILAIIGGLMPKYVSLAFSIIANGLLIFAFIKINLTFNELKENNYYNGGNTTLIIVGYSLLLIVSIGQVVILYVSFVGVLGYLFLALGFKNLADDINAIQIPGISVQTQPYSYPTARSPYQQPPTPVKPMAPAQTQSPQVQQSADAFCPKCGAKIEPNAKFCPYCGTKL